MVVVGADISATRSRPRVMVIQELLPAGDSAGGLWYSLVVVMMVVVIVVVIVVVVGVAVAVMVIVVAVVMVVLTV